MGKGCLFRDRYVKGVPFSGKMYKFSKVAHVAMGKGRCFENLHVKGMQFSEISYVKGVFRNFLCE